VFNKQKFVGAVSKSGMVPAAHLAEMERQFDDALPVAVTLLRAVPGIGFLSREKRLNAFWAVCRHIDLMVEKEITSYELGVFAISMLRIESGDFSKACAMFDFLAPRFDINAKASMPRSARMYLAMLLNEY